jgi:hypothetical protein
LQHHMGFRTKKSATHVMARARIERALLHTVMLN